MTGFSTPKPAKASAGADVQEAAAITLVANVMTAAEGAGAVAHRIDCAGLAHKMIKAGRTTDTDTFRLEADLLDLVLLQKATTIRDAIILVLVSNMRMGCLFDQVDKEGEPLADAIHCGIQNVAGYLLMMAGVSIIDDLPETLRESASDLAANYIGRAAVKGA